MGTDMVPSSTGGNSFDPGSTRRELNVRSSTIHNTRIWKQLKCPEEWIKKMWCIYTMEYYSAIEKNEIMPLAATWIDLEMIILSEVSQTEKDKYHMISFICGI